MKNIKNDMDIYFAVGNANTIRQEKEIRKILGQNFKRVFKEVL